MNKSVKAILALLPFLISMSLATQSIAKSVNYHEVIGKPIFDNLYAPWKIFAWYFDFGEIIPLFFDDAFLWLYGGGAISLGLIAVFFKRNKKLTSHGTAEWATEEDLYSTGLVPDNRLPAIVKRGFKALIKGNLDGFKREEPAGIILGLRDMKKKGMEKYYTHNGPEHAIVKAPTRSGKGIGLILPTLFTWLHSVVITDIKGENWDLTSKFRKYVLRNTVIMFKPTDTKGQTARFNPLTEVRAGELEEYQDVQNIVNIIVDPEGKGNLSHWDLSAGIVISTVVLHLLYSHPKPSFGQVLSVLKSSVNSQGEAVSFVELLPEISQFEHDKKHTGIFSRIYEGESLLETNPYTHPKVKEIADSLMQTPENELGSIISTAQKKLELFADPIFNKNTSESDFCIDDIMNSEKPVSLYLISPPSDIQRTASFFRMIIEMIVRKNTEDGRMYFDKNKNRQETTYKHRLLFLLDEFNALGKMSLFATELAYIAGFGMKAFLILQGLPQLNNTYGKDNEIITNCHVQIYYPSNDLETAVHVEKMLGKQTILVESTSSQGGIFAKKTVSKSPQARSLLDSTEFRNMYDSKDPMNGLEIISVTGKKPIKTPKVRYYLDDFFMVRQLGPVDKSDKLPGKKINVFENTSFDDGEGDPDL